MRFLNLLFLLLCCFHLNAQSHFNIKGHVYIDGQLSESVPIILEESNQISLSNKNGEYELKNLVSGKYHLYAKYQKKIYDSKTINLNRSRIIDFFINTTATKLNDFHVVSKHKIRLLRVNSIKSEQVDVQRYQQRATSIQNMLNSAPGIRLRNTGALGANTEIVVSGFSGKSIKVMRDGIPIDYLGSSFGVSKIPLNSLERIEVYKGVLPPEISVDALGGVVNFITKKISNSHLDFSLERGSFNTNTLSINGLYKIKSKISLGVYAFGNYSDNNYKVKHLPILDKKTGRSSFIEAPLFHNKFKQYFIETYINFNQLKWADFLELRLSNIGLHQDIQNDFITRDRCFGAVFRTEKGTLIPSINYKKNLLDNKISINQFLVFSHIRNRLVDTLRNVIYDWRGMKHEVISSSETSIPDISRDKNGFETNLFNIIYRGTINYRINNSNSITFNLVNNKINKIKKQSDETSKTNNTKYNRLIMGLGCKSYFFQHKLNTIAQLKLLSFQTDGLFKDHLSLKSEEKTIAQTNFGFSFSAKYNISPKLMIRSSFENSYRFPDQIEIFGNNTFILDNLSLSPERSNNINLGLMFHHGKRYNFEINSYYRNTKDLIKLVELNQYQGIFKNLEKVKGYGIEFEFFYNLLENLRIYGNLTYNEFRFNGSVNRMKKSEYLKNARVNNMPFYYGNSGIDYYLKNIFTKNSYLRFYWNYNYVHQYYLDFIEKQFEPDGFLGLYGKSKIYTKRIIPEQHIHNIGATYELPFNRENKIYLGFEIRNLFDRDTYNNFKIQNQGRSFWFKTTYILR